MNLQKYMLEVKLGIKTLMLHKLRSFLTMLGVVFGVGSVIAMLAVGEGASKEAMDQLTKLGSNNIIISAMKPVEDDATRTSRAFMSVYGLLYEDEQRIAESFPHVKSVVPVKQVRKQARLKERMLELRIVGTTAKWFDLVKRPILAGRVLFQQDFEAHAKVVVLTEHGARSILATEQTIGQNIKIGRDYFEVVGIVKSESSSSGGMQMPDQEIDAYIPINVARDRYGDVSQQTQAGSRSREYVELHHLIVEVRDLDNVESTANAIQAMLKRFHKKQDYKMSVPLALLRQAEATKRTFNIVLGSIAGISLLVGGIGIMNIMLASVTERTREIGIRRAIGAKRRQIILQFLIETIVLSTTGGVIGMMMGVAFPWIISKFAGMPTVVSPESLILSFGISMGVGIIFGIYPAMRASRLDPIVALRHE